MDIIAEDGSEIAALGRKFDVLRTYARQRRSALRLPRRAGLCRKCGSGGVAILTQHVAEIIDLLENLEFRLSFKCMKGSLC